MWRKTDWSLRWPLVLGFIFLSPSIGIGQHSGQDLQPTPQQAVRQWTDASGKRQAKARLLAANEQKARMEKRGGKIVTVAARRRSAWAIESSFAVRSRPQTRLKKGMP